MNTLPIMLSAEQHEQVKHRLAALLSSEYGITRQSAGKLEFLTAALMGFSNHHQRNAAIAALQQPAPREATSTTDAWPVGWLRDQQGEITTSDLAVLKSRGWVCCQDNGEYQDYEFAVTYAHVDAGRHSFGADRHSFNIMLTINHVAKTAYISLGDNLGDFTNVHLEFNLSKTSVLDANTYHYAVQNLMKNARSVSASHFADNFQRYTDAANVIISELIVIAAWCSPPTVANIPIRVAGCAEKVLFGTLAPRAH